MDISNGLNQPVSFVSKNTGNNINTVFANDNQIVSSSAFFVDANSSFSKKNVSKPHRKSLRGKRLNITDGEYLPDDVPEESVNGLGNEENIFLIYEERKLLNKLKKLFDRFMKKTPLINYFFLQKKKTKIQETVVSLQNISQNVDELITAVVPYGEEKVLYGSIAEKLNEAANIVGKANKELE